MNDHIQAVLSTWQGLGPSSEPDDAAIKAAEMALQAMAGLTYAQAEMAMHITTSALRGAAVVPRS